MPCLDFKEQAGRFVGVNVGEKVGESGRRSVGAGDVVQKVGKQKEESVAGRVTKFVRAGVTKNARRAGGSGEAERAGESGFRRGVGRAPAKFNF